MRVLQILSDFVRWRWAPCVGLLGASLFYVLFVILLIPSQVGASETEEDDVPAVETSESNGEGDEGATGDTHTSAPSPVKHIDRSSPANTAPPPKRRGFSPPLERPDPTPPAAPPPPPAAPPPPEQASTPPQAPPPPDPAAVAAAEEQQRLGAAAAARAATLAATRASRLSTRGLRPKLTSDAPAADPPVHEESDLGDSEEQSDAPQGDANAEQSAAADDSESDDSGGDEAEAAESQEAEEE